MENQGTPKTLSQAIVNAAAEALTAHIRDFMAQKFAVAMLKNSSDETEIVLRDLWKELTGEDYK